MKAISIRQPFALFVVKGLKPVENRNWESSYRGPLLIHAAKTFDDDGLQWVREHFPEIKLPNVFVLGCILGQVDMVDCVESYQSPWFTGRYGHVYEHPIEFLDPIPYRGMSGLFSVSDEVLREKV